MPITDDVRRYGETVLEQGKVALDEARKPWYAAVGAGELAASQLQAQLAQLPAEVQAGIRRLQQGGMQFDPAVVRETVENATAEGLKVYGTAAAQAKETYETLAHRGELVVRRLRRSSEVTETFEKAQELVAEAGETVAAAEDKVTKPGKPVTRKPATPKATGPKATTPKATTPKATTPKATAANVTSPKATAAKATPATGRKAQTKRTPKTS
jgi:exonuclease VII small subunit